jgi:uncharacterized membrane protein YkvA (DUF1232 family)
MPEPKKPKKATAAPKTSKAAPKKAAPKKAAPRKAAPASKKPLKAPAEKPRTHKADPRGSKAYKEAEEQAQHYAKDPKRLRLLFEEASAKSKEIPTGPFKETWAYLMVMIRLVRAYASGRYREIPWQSLVTIVVAVLYFISPVDFIPDFLPIVGYLDDAFVIGLAVRAVKEDLDTFMQWEVTHPE